MSVRQGDQIPNRWTIIEWDGRADGVDTINELLTPFDEGRLYLTGPSPLSKYTDEGGYPVSNLLYVRGIRAEHIDPKKVLVLQEDTVKNRKVAWFAYPDEVYPNFREDPDIPEYPSDNFISQMLGTIIVNLATEYDIPAVGVARTIRDMVLPFSWEALYDQIKNSEHLEGFEYRPEKILHGIDEDGIPYYGLNEPAVEIEPTEEVVEDGHDDSVEGSD